MTDEHITVKGRHGPERTVNPKWIAEQQAEHRARRERIATECLAALLTRMDHGSASTCASLACMYADALIAELDKQS